MTRIELYRAGQFEPFATFTRPAGPIPRVGEELDCSLVRGARDVGLARERTDEPFMAARVVAVRHLLDGTRPDGGIPIVQITLEPALQFSQAEHARRVGDIVSRRGVTK